MGKHFILKTILLTTILFITSAFFYRIYTVNKESIYTNVEEITKETNQSKEETDQIAKDENNLILEKERLEEINSNIEKMKSDILNYLGEESKYVSIVYYDLNNETGFEINKDIDYRSASTAKLFTVLCLYDYVHKNILDINEEIYYTPNDYEGGTGIMQGMDLSRPYSLKELADYSILHSDNIAFNMILRKIGYNEVINYYENIIGHNIEGTITMSASDGAKLLLKLYKNEENNPLYNDLINNLKNTDFKNRIERDLPMYSVAHKIGSYDSYIHDIGIVYTENPYILTVFTNKLGYAEDKIGDISKIIYDYNK